MADIKPNAPKEMSMEIRLLLAMVLMGVVIYVTQTFYKPTTPQRKQESVAETKATVPPPAVPKPAIPSAEKTVIPTGSIKATLGKKRLRQLKQIYTRSNSRTAAR